VDAALTATEKEARQVADRLSGDGHNPEVLTINRPPDLPGDSPLAYLGEGYGTVTLPQHSEPLPISSVATLA